MHERCMVEAIEFRLPKLVESLGAKLDEGQVLAAEVRRQLARLT